MTCNLWINNTLHIVATRKPIGKQKLKVAECIENVCYTPRTAASAFKCVSSRVGVALRMRKLTRGRRVDWFMFSVGKLTLHV